MIKDIHPGSGVLLLRLVIVNDNFINMINNNNDIQSGGQVAPTLETAKKESKEDDIDEVFGISKKRLQEIRKSKYYPSRYPSERLAGLKIPSRSPSNPTPSPPVTSSTSQIKLNNNNKEIKEAAADDQQKRINSVEEFMPYLNRVKTTRRIIKIKK